MSKNICKLIIKENGRVICKGDILKSMNMIIDFRIDNNKIILKSIRTTEIKEGE